MRFIVDVNLPKLFKFFNTPDFEFVIDYDARWSDTEIWNYAISNNLIILTKDTDFLNKCLLSDIKAKVVYFDLGPFKLNELHLYFSDNWETIIKAIQDNTLVVAAPKSITIVL